MRRGKVELALARAVRAASLQPEDGAAVELARKLAQVVDLNEMQYGRSLLEVLVQLHLTPKARAAVVKAAPPQQSGLDELRARRERGA